MITYIFPYAVSGQQCGCPNEWTYFDGSCYYLADDTAATWNEATV